MENKIEKYFNEEGKVGVLVSTGYGAGWSTWVSDWKDKDDTQIKKLFSKEIIEFILNNEEEHKAGEIPYLNDLLDLANTLFPGHFNDGILDVEIEWLEPGTKFFIDEYDGNEDLVLIDEIKYMVA